MPAIDRSTLVRGPATVTFDGVTWYSQGDVAIRITRSTFAVTVGGAKVDERLLDKVAEITFTPSGRALGLALFNALGVLALGTGLFGAEDKSVVVASAAGTWTFAAGRISKLPSIMASNVKTSFGAMTLKCIGANEVAPGTADAFLELAAGAAPGGEASAGIVTGPWTIGGAGLGAGIETEDGVTIDFAEEVSPQTTDSGGLVEEYLTGYSATATFVPLNKTLAEIVAGLNLTAARGSSLNTGGVDLVCANSAMTVTLKGATLTQTEASLSVDSAPQRGVVATATRASNATLQALFTIAAAG